MLFSHNDNGNNRKSRKNTSEIGRSAENLAADYLTKHGLKIINRNFSTRTGEIDLIALEPKQEQYRHLSESHQTLIFVEVKFRKNAKFGQPYETVSHSKQQKIIRTAQSFLQKHKKYTNNACRFDIISILNDEITWLKHAFE